MTASAKTDITMLRHAVATLAYRARKTLDDAPPGFSTFSGAAPQTPGRILAHLCDLFDWALSSANGAQTWRESAPAVWDEDSTRFFAALEAFDRRLAAPEALGCPAERLFQGPVADALTHVGQLAMLRRLAGARIQGENYYVADIATGRCGADQPPPRKVF